MISEKEYNRIVEERNVLLHENEILKKRIENLEEQNCGHLKKIIEGLEKNCNKKAINDNTQNCNKEQELNKQLIEISNLYITKDLQSKQLKEELNKLKKEIKGYEQNIILGLKDINNNNLSSAIDKLLTILEQIENKG